MNRRDVLKLSLAAGGASVLTRSTQAQDGRKNEAELLKYLCPPDGFPISFRSRAQRPSLSYGNSSRCRSRLRSQSSLRLLTRARTSFTVSFYRRSFMKHVKRSFNGSITRIHLTLTVRGKESAGRGALMA